MLFLPTTAHYLRGVPFTCDFETTNLEYGSALNPDNRVVMMSWALGWEGKIRHFVGNPLECKAFWDDLDRAEFVVAHNGKFEAHWLKRLGRDPADLLWFDTMLGEYVRLGNRFELLNLGDVAERYGETGKDPLADSYMTSGVCPSEMPRDLLIARCRRDVRTTRAIARKQIGALHKRGQLDVAMTRNLLMPVLTHIECSGMHLDKERVYETYTEYSKRRDELMAEFERKYGAINPRSGSQLAELLYSPAPGRAEDDPYTGVCLGFPELTNKRGEPRRNKATKRWPQGLPKTDADTLEWLMGQAKTKKQREFVELKQQIAKVDAALTKNLEFFKGVVDEKDETFRGIFNQCNTRTHRNSSSGVPLKFRQFPKEKSVQFQNMPRIFKKLFRRSRDGRVLIEVDGAQLEFRVAVCLGDDPAGRAMIASKGDVHKDTASVMFSVPLDAVTDDQRQAAKPDTFGPLYGKTTGSPELVRYVEFFREKYAGVYSAQEGWVSEVLGNEGVLTLPWGMRFHFPHYSDKRGVLMCSRTHKPVTPSIFNYPVQSLATAEIIPIALVYLFHMVREAGLDVEFVNTVHDSIVADVAEKDAEAFCALAVEAFTTCVYEYLDKRYGFVFDVPLGVGIKAGSHWGQSDKGLMQRIAAHLGAETDGKEIKLDVSPAKHRRAA